MLYRIALALTLSLTVACGGESTTTMATDSGGGSSGATDPGTGTGTPTSTTGGATTSEGATDTSEQPTGGSGGATEGGTGGTTEGANTGTTDPSGSGTGGQGSAIACENWYDALRDSYAPICECEVQEGNYRTVEECQNALAPSSDCTCAIFADAPETVELLKCYQKAAEDRETCLGGLVMCLLPDVLQGCIDGELAALVMCGAPSDEICMDLQAMCGGEVPPICE